MLVRNGQLKIYEDFFQGGDAQKAYFRKFQDENVEDYNYRLDKSVVINRCRKTVNTNVEMLYTVSPPERRMDDEDANKRMSSIWKFNRC